MKYYTIIDAPDSALLARYVTNHLADGWICQGGPFTYPYASGHGPVHQTPQNRDHQGCDGWIFVNFCQAMLKEEG